MLLTCILFYHISHLPQIKMFYFDFKTFLNHNVLHNNFTDSNQLSALFGKYSSTMPTRVQHKMSIRLRTIKL